MSSNNSKKGEMESSKDKRAAPISRQNLDDASLVSSTQEVSIIENMTGFLEAYCGADVDQKVLRNMAEALSKRLNDTSPGTLRDVTMDNSYGVGYRSPCVSLQQCQGATSPSTQGRSVREFEEQMASLRKENFNLKLRLYFIEESIPNYQQGNSHDGQEALLKQLIDAKVEIEILRKDIQDKQDILKEAAMAMNQLEKVQKEADAKYEATVDDLKQKIQDLEMEREMEKSHDGGVFMNKLLGHSDISQNIRELEGVVKQSDDKIIELQTQIFKLDNFLAKRDETIKEYEEKVKELVFQNSELLETLENKENELSTTEVQHLREELREQKSAVADKICLLQDAEEQLRNRTHTYEQACRTIKKLLSNIKNQQDEINKLKSHNTAQGAESLASATKENLNSSGVALSGFESNDMMSRSFSDTEALNDCSSGSQRKKFEQVIAEQDKTIQNLKAEVKKKTANLQNLVNNELWEKNREIERLTKIINQSKKQSLPLSPTSTTAEDATAAVAAATNVGASELQKSFSDIDYAKALERNKLLQRKVDILIQRLGVDRNNDALITQLNHDLREARASAEAAEKWRSQCADVCGLLSNRLIELGGFLNSLLNHKDVLGLLADERRRAIRKAVDRSLDISKSLNLTLSVSGASMIDQSLAQLSNLSEILGEFETNENKSLEELQTQESYERLKAENKALKKELDKRLCSSVAVNKKDRRSLPLPPTQDNQSESEAWSEPDRKVSLARIGLEEPSAALVKVLPSVPQADSDSESDALNQSRNTKIRAQERIAQLEQLIAQRDERILAVQCQLVDADSRLKKEKLRIIDMTYEVEQLRERNKDLHADLVAIGTTDNSNDIAGDNTVLLQQIEHKTRELEKVLEERDRTAVEARLAEMQIATLREEMSDLQEKYEIAFFEASTQEQQKLEQLQRDMDALLEKRLGEQKCMHKEALERDWIARTQYDEIKQQLTELQRQYTEAQRNIDYITENEQELRQTLVESELEARALKKQLDESTLQASKTVMERTKALNEKLQLEKQVQELKKQLQAHEVERSNLQQHVTKMEEQIAHAHTTTQRLNISDISQSGYTSEEVPHIQAAAANNAATSNLAKRGATQRVATVGAQRLNNSSPDLGIESDAGRVSSVELSNTQHALLKTIELAVDNGNAVMNSNIKEEDISDGERKPTNLQQLPNVQHDCAKVEQENAELRRKLMRTKRAFEHTYAELRISNHRKEQVEKEIKNQILKTHNVLKNVRSNMENKDV